MKQTGIISSCFARSDGSYQRCVTEEENDENHSTVPRVVDNEIIWAETRILARRDVRCHVCQLFTAHRQQFSPMLINNSSSVHLHSNCIYSPRFRAATVSARFNRINRSVLLWIDFAEQTEKMIWSMRLFLKTAFYKSASKNNRRWLGSSNKNALVLRETWFWRIDTHFNIFTSCVIDYEMNE